MQPKYIKSVMTISGILLREMSCVFSFIQDIRIDSINIIGGITDILEIRDLLYFDYFKKLNIFLIAGKNDPVIQSEQKFKNLEQFLNKLGYKNIKSKLYPDLRHEILNEKEYEQIYEDVLEFFKQ